MPPINANDDFTDEDSGDDNDVAVNNLPASQLLAEAEIYNKDEENEMQELEHGTQGMWDESDYLPLSHFVKSKSKKKMYKWEKLELGKEKLNIPWTPISAAANESSPQQLFEQFFDQETIQLLVDFTNMYALKRNRKADITSNELKCFLGVLLVSGFSTVSRRRMYWENSDDSKNLLISRTISRDRFEYIMSNIHCCDNDNLDENDRFAKLRPLFDRINKKCLEFAPHVEQHSIDEAMVPYFGRHPGKQFIKGKPVRYGYKLWVGTTSYGYINWFEPYQGAKSEMKKYKNLGLGPSVILSYADIICSKINASYHFFFDNFFSNIPLIEELTNRKIKATGTLRENRRSGCPLPSNKVFKKSKRGSWDFRSTNKRSIIVATWNDNNIVNIVSNCVGIQPTHTVSRFSRAEKKRVNLEQPQALKVYNKYMGGVDRSDQNMSLYRTAVRGKKWYFPLIAHVLDLAVQNAWVLHKKTENGKLDHLAFRRRIAIGLLETNSCRNNSKRSKPSPLENVESRFDRLDHIVSTQEKPTRCRVCHKAVSVICNKCKVALHIRCFAAYHTPPSLI